MQAKKPDVQRKKHGAKDSEIVQHFLCIFWPRNKSKLHFSLLYYTVISLPSGQLCYFTFPSSFSGLWDYSLTSTAEVDVPTVEQSLGKIHLPMEGTEHFFLSETPWHCAYWIQEKPLLLQARPYRSENKPCLFVHKGMLIIYKEARSWAPERFLELVCLLVGCGVIKQ